MTRFARFTAPAPSHHTMRFSLLVVVLGVACASPPAAPAPAPRPSLVVTAPEAPRRLAPVAALVIAPPASVGMDSLLPARLDSIMLAAIAEGAAPGGAVIVGRHGRIVHVRGYGTLDYAEGSPAVETTTLYDIASLTKVVATTTAAMILEEQGRLHLDSTVVSILPEFNAPDKATITVRMLLTHRGGLEAGAPLHRTIRGRTGYIAEINRRPVRSVPGTATIYSDWDLVVLQAIVERVAGMPLDEFSAARIFHPLQMADTRFTPDTADGALRRRIAPTAIDTARGGLLQGVVHDGNAWAIGGTAGHAGLFSSARELASFAQMLLDGGTYDNIRIVAPTTVARWTSRQDTHSSRALGWDTPAPASSAGRFFSPRSFGHTGFTGTSMWMDPERGLFVVLLTNRVNSRGMSTRHVQLRRDVADAAQSAILDAALIDWEARR